MTDSVRVLAAGSLRHAFPEIINAFTAATGIPVSLSLGPAGLLRERIEAGEAFDLFASANMAHPRRLAEIGIAEPPIRFAANRLCIVARADLGLTTDNILDVLTAPDLIIGTSTPGDDPGGDYAFEIFDRVETKHPGIGAAMRARACPLVGGRNSPPASGGAAALIESGQSNVTISYYSSARLLRDNPAYTIAELPSEFSPKVEYGLTVRRNASHAALRLRDDLSGDFGRRILIEHGFC